MYFSTIPLILFGLLVAEGGALPRDVGDYYWNLTQWQAGLSHGNPASPTTSWYSFTVSGSAYGPPESESYIPAFGARCTGSAAGIPLSSNFSDCVVDPAATAHGSSVLARVVPHTEYPDAHIAISYLFSNENGGGNLTAIAVTDWARERPPYNFTLGPIETS